MNRASGSKSGVEGLSLNLSEVESAVFLHKIDNGIKLLIYETSFVADHCYRDDRTCFIVLMLNFCNRNIEPTFQSPDNAFDDASLFLEGSYPLHMQLSCHHADNHFSILDS